MKLIVEIKEKYHQYAPDLFSLREKYLFGITKLVIFKKSQVDMIK